MRNLKRALSLALAMVMLMGMMVMGVGAKGIDFKDGSDVQNKEAVAIVSSLGLLKGYTDGTFGPDRTLTRAEMAVIISKILYGDSFNVDSFKGANIFSDVPEWAQGYVNFAQQIGVVAGVGDGKFNPNGQLKVEQAALMLEKALGWFQRSGELSQGGGWILSSMSKGMEIGLFDGMNVVPGTDMTRDNVAQMVFNAVAKTVPVKYHDTLNMYYSNEGNLTAGVKFNFMDTLGYKIHNLVYKAGGVKDLQGRPGLIWGTGSVRSTDKQRGVDDEGKLIDSQVTLLTRNEIISTPVVADHEYTGSTKGKDIYKDLGKDICSDDANWTVYYNGFELTETRGEFKSSRDANIVFPMPTKEGGEWIKDGEVAEFYVDVYEDKNDTKVDVIAVIYGNYLGEVTKVDTTKDRTISLAYDAIQPRGGLILDDTTYKTALYDEEDYVAFQIGYDETDKDFVIYDIYAPETAEGKLTAVQLADWYLRLDGDKHAISKHYNEVELEWAELPGAEKDAAHRVYKDENGFVLAVEPLEKKTENYLYVKSFDEDHYGLTAKVVFADGTSAKIDVTKLFIDTRDILWDGEVGTVTDKVNPYTDDVNPANASTWKYAGHLSQNDYTYDNNGKISGNHFTNLIKNAVKIVDNQTTIVEAAKNVLNDGTNAHNLTVGNLEKWAYRFEKDGDDYELYRLSYNTSIAIQNDLPSMPYDINNDVDTDGNTATDSANGYSTWSSFKPNAFNTTGTGSSKVYTDAKYGVRLGDNTIFVDIGNKKVYEGYKNVPDYYDLDTEGCYAYASKSTGVWADVVFITNGDPSGSAKDYFWLKDGGDTKVATTNVDYVMHEAYIDGTKPSTDKSVNEFGLYIKGTEFNTKVQPVWGAYPGTQAYPLYRIDSYTSDDVVKSVTKMTPDLAGGNSDTSAFDGYWIPASQLYKNTGDKSLFWHHQLNNDEVYFTYSLSGEDKTVFVYVDGEGNVRPGQYSDIQPGKTDVWVVDQKSDGTEALVVYIFGHKAAVAPTHAEGMAVARYVDSIQSTIYVQYYGRTEPTAEEVLDFIEATYPEADIKVVDSSQNEYTIKIGNITYNIDLEPVLVAGVKVGSAENDFFVILGLGSMVGGFTHKNGIASPLDLGDYVWDAGSTDKNDSDMTGVKAFLATFDTTNPTTEIAGYNFYRLSVNNYVKGSTNGTVTPAGNWYTLDGGKTFKANTGEITVAKPELFDDGFFKVTIKGSDGNDKAPQYVKANGTITGLTPFFFVGEDNGTSNMTTHAGWIADANGKLQFGGGTYNPGLTGDVTVIDKVVFVNVHDGSDYVRSGVRASGVADLLNNLGGTNSKITGTVQGNLAGTPNTTSEFRADSTPISSEAAMREFFVIPGYYKVSGTFSTTLNGVTATWSVTNGELSGSDYYVKETGTVVATMGNQTATAAKTISGAGSVAGAVIGTATCTATGTEWDGLTVTWMVANADITDVDIEET